jgi:hypothetical protein
MPVEIKELVIRAIAMSDSKDGEKPSRSQSPDSGTNAIVQECVRQVLSILKKEEER